MVLNKKRAKDWVFTLPAFAGAAIAAISLYPIYMCLLKNLVERKTGFEPATPTLARSCSTS
jgi:hypothetical protein